jgi:putative peptidoglycan lipid II flippase
MIGVSLVSADDWILRYFASDSAGAISHINYAKRLLAVPIAILGQAVGQASLPFFARLFGEKRMQEFADTVNGSVYRTAAAALLATSLMMASALPLIDLVYRLPRGHFVFSDSQATATYFFWFSASLVFWSAQGLYARAFYAAGNTLTPMVASSLITIASLPMYRALYHAFSSIGLALASDLGIAANCLAMGILLHQRKLVRWDELQWRELAKATLTATVAGLLSYRVARAVVVTGSRIADIEALALICITWAGAVAAGLWLTRSQLPSDLRRRNGHVLPRVAEGQTVELTKGIVP